MSLSAVSELSVETFEALHLFIKSFKAWTLEFVRTLFRILCQSRVLLLMVDAVHAVQRHDKERVPLVVIGPNDLEKQVLESTANNDMQHRSVSACASVVRVGRLTLTTFKAWIRSKKYQHHLRNVGLEWPEGPFRWDSVG